jgi:hypothetical protein
VTLTASFALHLLSSFGVGRLIGESLTRLGRYVSEVVNS